VKAGHSIEAVCKVLVC